MPLWSERRLFHQLPVLEQGTVTAAFRGLNNNNNTTYNSELLAAPLKELTFIFEFTTLF